MSEPEVNKKRKGGAEKNANKETENVTKLSKKLFKYFKHVFQI